MSYPEAAWERAMKVQEVIMKALTGELHWYRAADILGFSPRTLRRWRERYESHGYDGLLDLRRRTPSPKRVPVAEVTRIVTLYRDQYRGFNARHFHQIARREHDVTLSYSFVKQALQLARLLKKGRVRGRHRRRREPRACFGELLHLDGSRHQWFTLAPTEWSVLIAVLDDATKRVLYAQLWPSEGVVAVMTALREVIQTHGLPMALYTDRAHWAFHTPQANGPVDKRQLTQIGRALDRLGIEHIPAYSPQGTGAQRAAQSDVSGSVGQRAARRADHDAPGREYVSPRALSAGLQRDLQLRARRSRQRLRETRTRGPRADPLSSRRARRRTR